MEDKSKENLAHVLKNRKQMWKLQNKNIIADQI